jgi:hypothetical protein
MIFLYSMTILACLAAFCVVEESTAFAPQSTLQRHHYHHTSTLKPTTTLNAVAAVSVPNRFKKLPWNVRKEREREARRLSLERARLHRELGIAEDSSYLEIVIATDALILKAGDNLKQKIKVEVAKDTILQIRLNERLAGLAQQNKEASAMSTYEVEG